MQYSHSALPRCHFRTMCVSLLLLVGHFVLSVPPPNGGAPAAKSLAFRVLGPKAANLFTFHTLEAGACTSLGPCATVEQQDRVVSIGGTTPVEMAYGLMIYCRNHLHMSFTWERSGGFQTRLPDNIPPLKAPIRLQKRCSPGQWKGPINGGCYTHYKNVVTESYSQWVWDWVRWEREIDWMALHGINLVYAFNGQEKIWLEVFTELGLTEAEVQTSFNGPAWLGWSRSYESAWENGALFNPRDSSLNVSLQRDFLDGQHLLQSRIVAREIELGIGAMLPAFSGKVPGQLKRLFPDANISGNGSPGPAWVDGRDALFTNISVSFLSKAVRDWGLTGFYGADGYFVHSAAPWLSVTDLLGGHVECEYGAEIKNHFIPGQATDDGKQYHSLDAAKAACSADRVCGGALSRHCDKHGSNCTVFQTRSGWPSSCRAGVPCNPITKSDTIPGWQNVQNSFLITNAPECGHGPHAGPTDHGHDAYEHASAVYAAMRQVDPHAVWVYQAWPWMRSFCAHGRPSAIGRDYMSNFTSAVPSGRLVLLDMHAEAVALWRLTDSFYNTSFVVEVMNDFGGTNGMFGDIAYMKKVVTDAAALAGGAPTLAGAGISMEGIDQNAPMYEAVLDGLWEHAGRSEDEGLNTTAYLVQWGTQRCGKPLPAVQQAWVLLANTTYRPGTKPALGHRYCSNVNPSNNAWANSGKGWTKSNSFWRGGWSREEDVADYAAQLFRAWVLLAASAGECNTTTSRFDVADVGREWLQTVSCVHAYTALFDAWHAPNRSATAVQAAGEALTDVLLDMDRLLSSVPGFLFGDWIRQARALGQTNRSQEQLVMAAKTQVTDWASYPPGQPWSHAKVAEGKFSGIQDYAIKQWGGLIKTYQAVRVGMFVRQVVADARQNASEVDVDSFTAAFKRRQLAWVQKPWDETELPDHPVGDVSAISKDLQAKYGSFGATKL